MSDEKVVVVFKQSWRGYSTGEKAGFDEAQAKALVDGKVADLAKGSKAAAKPAASKPAAAKPKPGAGDDTPPAPDTPPADEEPGADDEPKP
ncbi:hypothetical protein [Pseudomonas sp.]|uniref:hypothetical protein n=1 Tax=Pseudomonas sp. TaxID=306 RepID=UPI003D1330FE